VRAGVGGKVMAGEAKLIKVEDILGDFGFTLKWELLDHWADITVYDKVGYEPGEPPKALYLRKGWKDSADHVYHIDEAQPYLTGFVKWDGCAELDQGTPHWCGLAGFKMHCDLLQYIYIRSQQLIKRADRELFGGPWASDEAADGSVR
jgi:hypothetical protein